PRAAGPGPNRGDVPGFRDACAAPRDRRGPRRGVRMSSPTTISASQPRRRAPIARTPHPCHWVGQSAVQKQVLVDLNLKLHPGEIILMSGPSGSGKTTLLTLIGALRSVQQGGIEVLGRELSGLSQRELVEVRRRIGFIFQGHNLFESLTAYQN